MWVPGGLLPGGCPAWVDRSGGGAATRPVAARPCGRAVGPPGRFTPGVASCGVASPLGGVASGAAGRGAAGGLVAGSGGGLTSWARVRRSSVARGAADAQRGAQPVPGDGPAVLPPPPLLEPSNCSPGSTTCCPEASSAGRDHARFTEMSMGAERPSRPRPTAGASGSRPALSGGVAMLHPLVPGSVCCVVDEPVRGEGRVTCVADDDVVGH